MKIVRAILAIGALVTVITACAATPEQCDLQQPAGSCAVRIETKKGQMMVCSGEQPAQAAPVCMNAVVDVTTAKGYTTRKLLLAPGECRTLGSNLSSAAQASCVAFAVRTGSSAVDSGK
jgi:hypothetical protein